MNFTTRFRIPARHKKYCYEWTKSRLLSTKRSGVRVSQRGSQVSVRRGKQRTMIYIPPALEETVRAWVQNGKLVDDLLDFVSQQGLEQLLVQKEQALGRT